MTRFSLLFLTAAAASCLLVGCKVRQHHAESVSDFRALGLESFEGSAVSALFVDSSALQVLASGKGLEAVSPSLDLGLVPQKMSPVAVSFSAQKGTFRGGVAAHQENATVERENSSVLADSCAASFQLALLVCVAVTSAFATFFFLLKLKR